MQNILETIKYYYSSLAANYQVNPLIFMCIHFIGTPLFIICIGWVIKNYKQKKSLILPLSLSLLVYNVGNVYLIIYGKNIGWYIYVLIAATTIISGYFTYKKVRVNMSR